jgi:hypothetical protein
MAAFAQLESRDVEESATIFSDEGWMGCGCNSDRTRSGIQRIHQLRQTTKNTKNIIAIGVIHRFQDRQLRDNSHSISFVLLSSPEGTPNCLNGERSQELNCCIYRQGYRIGKGFTLGYWQLLILHLHTCISPNYNHHHSSRMSVLKGFRRRRETAFIH